MGKLSFIFIFIILSLVCIGGVRADNCGPTGQCAYSNLDLNGLYLAFGGWSGQVGCGDSSNGYSSTTVLNTHLCGGNQQIGDTFGSVAATPNSQWKCITNNICNSKLDDAFNNVKIIHTISTGTASYPTCPTGYSRFDDNIMYTGLVRQSYAVICIKNEYFEYFKGEFRFAATGGGAWDPGDGTNCDTHIYDYQPDCPSGYKVLSRNFVADAGGCKHGMVIRAAMCVRDSAPSGIIDLDYNEAKCKTILGDDHWFSERTNGDTLRCCGDDGETMDQCSAGLDSVCSGRFNGDSLGTISNLYSYLTGSDGCCGDDVLNGDFEILEGTKLDEWTESTGTIISQSNDDVITGKNSLKAVTSDPSGDGWQSVNSDVFIPVVENQYYVVSGDIKINSIKKGSLNTGYGVSLIIHIYDANKVIAYDKQSIVLTESTAGFVHVTNQVYAQKNGYAQVILGIQNLDKTSEVFFDNVHFEKINVYSPTLFPTLEDYGFINSNGYGYLCYNYNGADLTSSTTTSAWTWLDAGGQSNPFKIIPIGTPDGTTDVISNSDQWFFCNATGNGQLNGIPIPEYSTFKPTYTDLTSMDCNVFLELMTGVKYGVCNADITTQCCYGGSLDFDDVDFGNCDCYDGEEDEEIDFCNEIPQLAEFCNEEDSTFFSENGLIEKSLCNFDLTGCLSEDFFNSEISCEDQELPTEYNHDLCIPDETYCKDGTYISTNEDITNKDNKCCVGIGSSCEPLPEITIDTCVAPYELYNSDEEGVFCQDYVSIKGTLERCCLTNLIRNDIFNTNFLGAISNESFICFAQEGNNKIADCCFGSECANKDNFLPLTNMIDYAKRLYSTGHALQSVSTYDKYDEERDMFVDYVYKYTVTSNKKVSPSIRKSINLAGFSYIEFDVAYNSDNIKNIFINDVDYGPLSDFFNNGNQSMRWHHAIIPLKNEQKNQKLNNLTIFANRGIVFLIDNIILTPSTDADLDVNSKNYYCTGGFGTWISDLDPVAGTDFSDWKSYGQYKFACEAQGSYGWTGHQCCGDDTKLVNYGEHFNDSLAGCFNGTYMMNNWTVWDAKNIADWESEFDDYYYNDLLYYNNKFIGCQVENGKYDSLKSSIDGSTLTTNLVNSYENTQCQQIGRYYCMNNAWHKEIITGTYPTMYITEGIIVALKHSPPGSELIINGDFGD